MHIQKDYHICDHCKSEIPSNQKIKVVVLPVECGGFVLNGPVRACRVELCNDCYKELLHVIRKHFHQWSYSSHDDLVDDEEKENE